MPASQRFIYCRIQLLCWEKAEIFQYLVAKVIYLARLKSKPILKPDTNPPNRIWVRSNETIHYLATVRARIAGQNDQASGYSFIRIDEEVM